MIPLRTLALIFVTGAVSVPSLNGQDQPMTPVAKVQTQIPDPPQASSSSSSPESPDSNGWHFELSPYLWFAGAHGTVGALGRTASVHASLSDLISHFNFGLMGAAEARDNRFLLTGDLLWLRLSDSRALPFPGVMATSLDVRVGQFVWTSKIGYRVIDYKRLKADATVGARYWHLGQRLNLNPSFLGLSITPSQSWADIVVGGRARFPLGPRMSLLALGDVGGWNATAKLDYQFAGLLNFEPGLNWVLSVGYRYLFVDYRNQAAIYNMVTSGPVLGITYRFK